MYNENAYISQQTIPSDAASEQNIELMIWSTNSIRPTPACTS